MTLKERLDSRMLKWADTMINHSLGAQFKEKKDSIEGKLVLVRGEAGAEPLMQAFAYSILEAGGYPDLQPHFATHMRGWRAGVPEMEVGSDEQLAHIPEYQKAMFQEAGAQVIIIGSREPFLLGPYQAKLAAVRKANMVPELIGVRLSKPWTLTLFPFREEAVLEGFSNQQEYEDFVIQACLADYAKMARDQEVVKSLMESAETVTIRSHDPVRNKVHTLEARIGKNKVDSCAGKNNVPDGEVYTSPDFAYVHGEIFFDVPIINNGREISGVYLKLDEKGTIIEYSAQVGGDALREVIETDEGSHRIAEVAVGTNPNVKRALKNILFAEKIGGTCHLAIGRSYEDRYVELDGVSDPQEKERIKKELMDAGRLNDSAQHLDIPVDFRNPKLGEGLYIGGTEVKWTEDKWVPV